MSNLDQMLGYYWSREKPVVAKNSNNWRMTHRFFSSAINGEYGKVFHIALILLFLCLLVFSAADSFASSFYKQENLTFDRLGTEDGLSQAVVNTIVQDKYGFIWVGTQEGLNRYDGYSFETYFKNRDYPEALSDDWISDLLVDREGNLWIATGGGLNRFNPGSRTFTRYVPDQRFADDHEHASVYVLYEDRSGYLWVGTSVGLSRYLGDGTFENFIHDPGDDKSLGPGAVLAIYEDSRGNLWVGTEQSGLNRLDRNKGLFVRYQSNTGNRNSLSDNHVRAIIEVEDGTLWVGTFNGGITVLDIESNRMSYLQHSSAEPTSLSSNKVRDFLKDRHGNLWIAADKGLNLWMPEEQGFQHFTNDPVNANSLSHDEVTDLFEDDGGVIWVGTRSGGVSKWNNSITTFLHIWHKIDDDNTLSDNQITSFTEGLNNELWIGTFGGLNSWNTQSGKFNLIHQGDQNLSGEVVMSLLMDSRARLWVGTRRDGLNLRESGETDFRQFRNRPGDVRSLRSDKISNIFEDSKGRIWIGTYGGGIHRYLEDGRFQRYPAFEGDAFVLSGFYAVDIAEDKDGIIWIATERDGVTLLDPETGKTRFFRQDHNDKFSVSSDQVITLLRNGDDMWVGTRDKGLNLFNYKQQNFSNYNKQQGLASNAIYGLVADTNGRLWISGNKGISVLDPKTGEIFGYDSTHGLQSNDFNHGASLKTSDGYFLFGGSNGFNVFDPLSIRGNVYIPPIVLTRFTKFNKPFNFDVSVSDISSIELAYNDYVIGFEFAAMDYTAPERNKFRYMLEGFDRDWVEVQGVHQATYTNLDAGKYKFRVIGSNNDDQWNTDGLSIDLLVKPPLWATWWAYLAYVLVGAAMIYYLWRSYSLRLKREAEERYNRELQLYIESLEEASDCVLIADEEGILKYANNAVYSMMGIIPKVARGKPMAELLFSSPRDAEEAARGLKENDRWHGEVFNRRGNEDYTAEVTISKVNVGTSNDTAYVSIARDITARKRTEEELANHRQRLEELVDLRTEALRREIVGHKAAEKKLAASLQEKELLLKEVHHRVKNNMQVISSLLNIQAESIDDEKFSMMLSASQQRIKSMALIHENLYQSDNLLGINFQEYIEMLGNSLCRFYTIKGMNICMEFNVEDISLDIETAVPCGLIINELISNSLKYAYKGRTGIGRIGVSFRRFEDSYILTISDDGNGMPEDFSFDNITSMGLEIICILTDQLDGNIQLVKSKGTTFRISFPEKDAVWQKQA